MTERTWVPPSASDDGADARLRADGGEVARVWAQVGLHKAASRAVEMSSARTAESLA